MAGSRSRGGSLVECSLRSCADHVDDNVVHRSVLCRPPRPSAYPAGHRRRTGRTWWPDAAGVPNQQTRRRSLPTVSRVSLAQASGPGPGSERRKATNAERVSSSISKRDTTCPAPGALGAGDQQVWAAGRRTSVVNPRRAQRSEITQPEPVPPPFLLSTGPGAPSPAFRCSTRTPSLARRRGQAGRLGHGWRGGYEQWAADPDRHGGHDRHHRAGTEYGPCGASGGDGLHHRRAALPRHARRRSR